MRRFLLAVVAFGFTMVIFLSGIPMVLASTCSISSSLTIDAAYVDSNTCDIIALTGTPTITWSGTIDTGRAVAVQVNSGTIVFSGALTLGQSGSSVTIASGATVTHANANIVGVNITAPTVTIIGSINVSGKGCQPGPAGSDQDGFAPSLSTGICAQGVLGTGYGRRVRGGAAHGGAGGAGTFGSTEQITTYGSSVAPVLLGSSGSSGINGGEIGGAGGGVVRLVVSGTLQIDTGGSIRADSPSAFNSGGGSGGSVYLTVGTIAGAGTVSANGGDAGNDYGGGGGGGRVRIEYGQNTSFNFASATATKGNNASVGPFASTDGSDGTVTTLQTNVAPDVPTFLGQPSLVDGTTTSTATPTFSFTLSDPDVVDTVKYQIQIDDSADFGSPIIDYTGALAVQGIQTFQVGQVAGSGSYVSGQDAATLSNGSYYWQVRTIDANAAVSSYEIARGGSIAFVVDSTPRYLSFESVTGSGLESVTATSVRVLLDIAHFENVTTTYSVITASTTAEGAGADYVLATGEAVIAAGETSTTISLVIVDDQIDEPNETIGIELSSPIHAIIGSNTSTLYTILDDDAAGVTVVQVLGPLAVTEGGVADAFTMVLDSAPTSTVQISFSTSTLGLTLSTSTLTFTSSDWNVAQTVYATGTNDRVYEGAHVTSVQPLLTTSAYAYGYEGLGISSFAGTITDNDTAGVTITPTTVSIAEGLTTDTYQVVLDSQPTSTIRITFATSTNGVTLDAVYLDFTSSNWETPQSVLVTATDDLVAENTHTSPVSHTASVLAGYALGYSGAGPSISDVTATITDNDSAGVSISKNVASVTEGGDMDEYTVVLTAAPTSTVIIAFTLSDDQVALSASTMTFTALNWSTPQTVTVTAANDQGFEFAKTTTITHVASSDGIGYVSGLSIGSVTVTVLDNDDPGGGGAGAGVGIPIFAPVPIPVEPIKPTVIPAPQETKPVIETILNPSDVMSLVQSTGKPRDIVAENTYASLIEQDIKALKVTASENDIVSLANFVTYGISKDTVALGSGERKAVVKDAIQTMGTAKIHPADLERMTRGVIPQFRNLAIELQQLPRVRQTFTSIYGHDPNFKNTEENLAWNVLMYRIRFPRDLKAEQDGIKEFKSVFGRDPKDPFQWATVRVMGYVRR